LRFAGRAAADREGKDFYHPDTGSYRHREHVARRDLLVGTVDPAAVEADVTLLGKRLGERAALGEAQEPQELVDPHAGAWPWRAGFDRLSLSGVGVKNFRSS
jgi:hypothetical protein